MSKSSSRSSSSKARRRKLIGVVIVLALIAAGVGFGGFHYFKKWRADDLATKARANFEDGNYRIAWIQINSARDMQPSSSEVLRSSAIIEAGFGSKEALDYWSRLAGQTTLSVEDLEKRAQAAARFGNDEQFAQAIADFEKVGSPERIAQLRAARMLDQGNADSAIEEIRRSASMSDDPAMRLDLMRLLVRRYMDRLTMTPEHPISLQVIEEVSSTVDKLQGTPVANDALSIGLSFLPAQNENMERWAEEALKTLDSSNSALVPAARRLVALGKTTPTEMNKKLRPVFDAAPLNRRAEYAQWLTNAGLAREALALLTDQEAAETEAAFVARAGALAAMENWNGVLQLTDVNGNVPEHVRMIARARAEYALGRGEQSGAKSIASAVRSSIRTAELQNVIALGDSLGADAVVDATLVELAGDPAVGARAFHVARDRFGRRGDAGSQLLAAAHERATKAAPESVEVADYNRYLQLLKSKNAGDDTQYPAPEETAAAVAARPDDVAVRMTNVLALLRANRAPEALNLLEDFTVAFNRMTPSQQAILAAAFAANGKKEEARIMTGVIKKDGLTSQEKALIDGL